MSRINGNRLGRLEDTIAEVPSDIPEMSDEEAARVNAFMAILSTKDLEALATVYDVPARAQEILDAWGSVELAGGGPLDFERQLYRERVTAREEAARIREAELQEVRLRVFRKQSAEGHPYAIKWMKENGLGHEL